MTVARLLLVNLTVWWKSSARLVGGRAKRNAIAAAIATSWIAWLYLGSSSVAGSSADVGATADRPVFEALTMLAVGVGWMSSAIANLYVTARPVLDTIVAVMPVSAHQRAVTDRLLPAALAAVATVLVLAPVLWPLVGSLGSGLATSWCVLTLLAVLLTGTLLGQVTHMAMFAAHLALRPAGQRRVHERAGVLSATVAIGVLVWSYATFSHGERAVGPLRVATTVAVGAAGGKPFHLAGVVAVLVAAALLLDAAARIASRQTATQPVDRSPATLRALTLRRGTLVRLELALWTRDRFNRGTLVALSLGIVTTVVARLRNTDAGVVALLVSSLTSVAALAGASSYGSTRRWHWAYVVVGRHAAWAWPKLTSIVSAWCVMALAVGSVAVSTGAWRVAEIGPTIGLSALPLLSVSLVGLAVPASTQHSMQSLATLFASLCVSTATLPALLSLPIGQSGWSILLLGTVLAGVVACSYRRSGAPRPPTGTRSRL